MRLLRSFILLACLIGVPAVAIVGPSSIGQLLSHAWPFDSATGSPQPERVSVVGADDTYPHAPGINGPRRMEPPRPAEAATSDASRQSAVPSVPANSNPPGQVPDRSRFAQFEQRLQELGASYYRLETWGAQGDQFHFHCLVPQTSNQAVLFEETGDDPFQVVSRVVQQVETWRVSRFR